MRLNPIFVEYLKLVQSSEQFLFWDVDPRDPHMLFTWEHEFKGKKRKLTIRYDKEHLEIINSEGEMGFAKMLLKDFERLKEVVYGAHYEPSEKMKELGLL